MTHRTAVCLLTCALAFVTGVALLGAAAAVRTPAVDTPRATATEAAVRGYYDAVDELLQTGDSGALETAVAPDFVDHNPLPGVDPNRAGLTRSLLALRAAAPSARFAVSDVTAAGDRGLARAEVRGAEQADFLGLPLRTGRPRLWGGIDVFRVSGGRVAERWGDTDGLALLEPVPGATLAASLPANPNVAIGRVEIPPGKDVRAWLIWEACLIDVESGAIDLTSANLKKGEKGPETTVRLAAGEATGLAGLLEYKVRNDGDSPAVIVIAGTFPGAAASMLAGSYDPAYAQWAPPATPAAQPNEIRMPIGGQMAVLVAGGRTATLPAGPAVLGLGRATLAPGVELPLAGATGAVLVAVEAGDIEVWAGGGTPWVRRDATGMLGDESSPTLAPGDGALVAPGDDVLLRNAGDAPATVLVATILPATQAAAAS